MLAVARYLAAAGTWRSVWVLREGKCLRLCIAWNRMPGIRTIPPCRNSRIHPSGSITDTDWYRCARRGPARPSHRNRRRCRRRRPAAPAGRSAMLSAPRLLRDFCGALSARIHSGTSCAWLTYDCAAQTVWRWLILSQASQAMGPGSAQIDSGAVAGPRVPRWR